MALLLAAAPHLSGRTWHDCAPWDGPAFRVVLPVPPPAEPRGSSLRLSIWQPALIRSPRTFRFPRDSGLGAAVLETTGADTRLLQGTLHIDSAVPTASVRGSFDLAVPGGGRYRGIFTAPWQPQRNMCG